jgi:hypothetical protein
MDEPSNDEVLRPRKVKWALVLLVSVAFVGIGLMMLRHPSVSGDRIWSVAGVVFFGVCGIASLLQFLPGSSFLRLTPEGLAIRAMWRTTFYRWSDIERFGVAELKASAAGVRSRHRMVGLDFSASYPCGDKARTLKSINRTMTGFEGALPDNYGWDCAELAAHLNSLRERYVDSPRPAGAV